MKFHNLATTSHLAQCLQGTAGNTTGYSASTAAAAARGGRTPGKHLTQYQRRLSPPKRIIPEKIEHFLMKFPPTPVGWAITGKEYESRKKVKSNTYFICRITTCSISNTVTTLVKKFSDRATIRTVTSTDIRKQDCIKYYTTLPYTDCVRCITHPRENYYYYYFCLIRFLRVMFIILCYL